MKRSITAALLVLVFAPISSAQHFQILQETQFSHAVLIDEALVGFGTPLQRNDEIAFFDPQGVCAGVATFDDASGSAAAALYGDIPETDFDEGFSDGDAFAIRVWRAFWRREAQDEYTISYIEGPNRWQDQAFTVIRVRGQDHSPDFAFFIESDFHDFGVLDMVVDQPHVWQSTIRFHGPHESYPVWDMFERTGDTAAFRIEFNPQEVPSDSNCTISVTYPNGNPAPGSSRMSLWVPWGAPGQGEMLRLEGDIGFARLIIPRAQLSFGEVAVEPNDLGIPTEARDSIEIRNPGEATLICESTIQNPYRFDAGQARLDSIPPDSVLFMTVIFDPDSVGEYDRQVALIRTNSWSDPPNATITLSGRGVDARAVKEVFPIQPSSFGLFSVYPNPFNSSTTIDFSLPSSSTSSSLRVYGLDGRLVADLIAQSKIQNPQSKIGKVVWDASGVGAGVYVVRLESERESLSRKVVLMR